MSGWEITFSLRASEEILSTRNLLCKEITKFLRDSILFFQSRSSSPSAPEITVALSTSGPKSETAAEIVITFPLLLLILVPSTDSIPFTEIERGQRDLGKKAT